MVVSELASALLLASAPVQDAGIASLPITPLSTAAANTEVGATLEKPDIGIDAPSAPNVPDEPIRSADPALLIFPAETIADIPPTEQIAVSSDPSAQIEIAEAVQDGNEIIVTARTRSPIDPLQTINAESYAIIQAIDEAVVEPSAHAYEKVVPEPVRNGLRNFANNLHEPAVFVNFLLQLKPGKAAETAGRFLVNSTVGVAGLFDMAKRKPINLPRRRNGFADTLGCYGVKSGPFLFLPLIGATTVRDLIGGSIDGFNIPLPLPGTVARSLTQPPIAISRSLARELDKRIDFDEDLQKIRNSSDPYVATREHYLQRRQAQIDENCGKRNINVETRLDQTATMAPLFTNP